MFLHIDAYSCSRLPNSDNAKGRLPQLTAWYEGVNTPDLFVLGTAAHSRDYRSSAGGFVHGFRYTGEAPHVAPLLFPHQVRNASLTQKQVTFECRVACCLSGFDAARAVHRVLEHRYHGNKWKSTELLTTQLMSWVLKRINEASGIYQMVGVLGDVILLRG